MNEQVRSPTPLLLMPFVLLWRLLGFIIVVCSRIVGAVLGFLLMVAGGTLTMSVLGAVAGIPLCILGFLLLLRALF